jgi:hypothetical protein
MTYDIQLPPGEEFCLSDKLAVPQCHGSGNSLRLLDRVNNPSVLLTISCHALQDPLMGLIDDLSRLSLEIIRQQGEAHDPLSWHRSLVPFIGTAACYCRLVLLLGTITPAHSLLKAPSTTFQESG